VTQSVNAQKEQVNTFKYTYPNSEIGINPVSFIGGTVGYAAHKAKNLLVGPDLQFSLAGKKLDVNTTDFGRVLGGEEGERWGFFNRICDSEAVLGEARKLAM
jgi:hypothetical protein